MNVIYDIGNILTFPYFNEGRGKEAYRRNSVSEADQPPIEDSTRGYYSSEEVDASCRKYFTIVYQTY